MGSQISLFNKTRETENSFDQSKTQIQTLFAQSKLNVPASPTQDKVKLSTPLQKNLKIQTPSLQEKLSSLIYPTQSIKYLNLFNSEPEKSYSFYEKSTPDLDKLLTEKLYWYQDSQAQTFAQFYLQSYENDLPVYVTSDSVLHAFHKSFDALLSDLEKGCLMTVLSRIFEKSLITVQNLKAEHESNPQVVTLLESAKLYFEVGQAILNPNDGFYEYTQKLPSFIPSEAASKFVKLINSGAPTKIIFFNAEKNVDFSQFKPRGHYTNSHKLASYFQAMMWLSQIKFHIPTEINSIWLLSKLLFDPTISSAVEEMNIFMNFIKYIGGAGLNLDLQSIYELGTSKLKLSSLLLSSEEQNSLKKAILEAGKNPNLQFEFTKNVNFAYKSAIPLLESLKDMENLQNLDSDNHISVISQSFTVDTWFMYEILSDNIMKPRRRFSALDLAYGLFNNEEPKETLLQRMQGTNSNPMKFRDGIDYLEKLETARTNIRDSINKQRDLWRNSLYSHWLLALTTLSERSNYPSDKVYDTKAWARKQIDSQIGSYAELKHDTVLYVQQCRFGGMMGCSYPEVVVEPNVVFWMEMKNLVKNLRDMSSMVESGVAKASRCGKEVKFLIEFENTLDMLVNVVKLQINKKPLDKSLAKKLEGMMFQSGEFYMKKIYNGWYYNLFYDKQLILEFDPEVSDIYTAGIDEVVNDPGCVMHLGIERPKSGLILLRDDKTGEEKCLTLAGYKYREFFKSYGCRLDDKDWARELGVRKPKKSG